MSEIKVVIDGVSITAQAGSTILDIATANGIKIPTLCYDERVKLYGACGLCTVEVEGIPKLLRACSSKASDGMVIHTTSDRINCSRKIALELLLSDHTGDCRGPCKLNCPAGTDCQEYIRLIGEGKYKESVKVIKEKLPLPASIGRVCPHPCEDACRRQMVEEPLAIAWLKSFVADADLASDDTYKPTLEPDSGKRVAVIGGGPGGLTAAYFLRTMGHSVVIFDAMPKMGGMLRYGIPQYRLPKEVLDKEIAEIASLGVEMKNNIRIGKDISFEEIKSSYDSVLVAIGAWTSTPMGVKGEELEGVYGGIDFLGKVALDEKIDLGEKVAVVGGGNTAMDACRTAVRLGAKEVYVIYRRTRAEMPAANVEIDEAEEEGVVFKFLTNPVEILSADGKVSGIKLQKMELGEPDASGRRKPVAIEGEFEEIALDNVIIAIGQYANTDGFDAIEKTRKGTIAADEHSFRTSLENVFAVGDATNAGADIAIAAIGEAQKACVVINNFLDGVLVPYKKPYVVEKEVTPQEFEDRPKQRREKMPHISPEERKTNFEEIVLGFSKEQAQKEASRCLSCGCHDYYDCKLIEYANDYDVNPSRFGGEKHARDMISINPKVEHDPNKCVLCGLCMRVCEEEVGKTVLGLLSRGFDTVVNPMFESEQAALFCTNCGKCVELCPTGALRQL
ncbi:MAG: 2Fe-2S iron-sulfur cluster binding domain-containing protein [Clostridia bacterium]|nr:2Fe-2S iron-sulfur cluster binding domain-containing protein [Clostridia bacterium]